MSFQFQAHDIAGYQGKEVQLWVKASNATTPNGADTTPVQIRGAQNFNPTEERAESKVSELGFAATKVIYGTTSFSVSTSLLIRDLVQIARLCGLDPSIHGSVELDGKSVKIATPAYALSCGVMYVTEDRKRTGLCLDLPAAWNMTLPCLAELGMKHILRFYKTLYA